MLKHYTNVFRENSQEEIEDLLMIGLSASVGAPGDSIEKTGEEIASSGLGIVGIYIDVGDDTREARDIVNSAWTSYFEKHKEFV